MNPRRITEVADSNVAYWHSATFSNDGNKLLFRDEWGGGNQAKCRATDPQAWGANAIFAVESRRTLRFRSYYKLPAAQTPQENCVAHNGSLIPIPGRDVMVQAWYQGGISVFDFTDAARPREIAFFDRGPISATVWMAAGRGPRIGYNGVIVSSEIMRGLDILELVPSPLLSENEIAAARTVRLDHFNPQGQERFVWPASFALARAYLDQLERSGGLAPEALASARRELAVAEAATPGGRLIALNGLAARLKALTGVSNNAEKVRLLVRAVRQLAEEAPPEADGQRAGEGV